MKKLPVLPRARGRGGASQGPSLSGGLPITPRAVCPPVLYGVLFEKDKEAAFANYRLGEALGFVIAFGYSAFLCVSVKLYILLGVLCLTMVAYGIVEYQESQDLGRPPAEGATRPAEEGETQTKM